MRTALATVTPLNFAEFFAGTWEVEIRTHPPTSTQTIGDSRFEPSFVLEEFSLINSQTTRFLAGEITIGNYWMWTESAGSLKGIYYENVTNSDTEFKNALRVHVELHSPTSGLCLLVSTTDKHHF